MFVPEVKRRGALAKQAFQIESNLLTSNHMNLEVMKTLATVKHYLQKLNLRKAEGLVKGSGGTD